MKTVKIFGERNTSTNALCQLIEQNSQSRVVPSKFRETHPKLHKLLKRGDRLHLPRQLRERITDHAFARAKAIDSWKHAATRFENIDDLQDVHVIFCVRHPASWTLGLYRRPYHIYGAHFSDLNSFLDARWRTAGRERLNRATMSATETYNAKISSYAALQAMLSERQMAFSIVRHEDFAMNQAEVFRKIAPHLNQPNEKVLPLKTSTKDKDKDADYYKKYYGEKLWLKDIDARSLGRINDTIDWDQLSAYAYDPT